MSRKSSQIDSRNNSRINHLRLLVGLLSAGLSIPALAQSVPFPTYQVGPQPNGTYVVSDGTIITPAGTQVDLGIRVRAKAIALNPTGNHTAAVLTLGTSASNGNGAVEVFSTQTGAVLQSYNPFRDSRGSHAGITYTSDGKYLLFSQDNSYVAMASVDPATGLLTDYAHISVPIDANVINVPGYGNVDQLTTVNCFPYNDSVVNTPGTIRVPPAALQFRAAFPSARELRIPWASRFRQMARPPTWCWMPTTRWPRST